MLNGLWRTRYERLKFIMYRFCWDVWVYATDNATRGYAMNSFCKDAQFFHSSVACQSALLLLPSRYKFNYPTNDFLQFHMAFFNKRYLPPCLHLSVFHFQWMMWVSPLKALFFPASGTIMSFQSIQRDTSEQPPSSVAATYIRYHADFPVHLSMGHSDSTWGLCDKDNSLFGLFEKEFQYFVIT